MTDPRDTLRRVRLLIEEHREPSALRTALKALFAEIDTPSMFPEPEKPKTRKDDPA